MAPFRLGLSRCIALPLYSVNVEQYRAVHGLRPGQCGAQLLHIVAVHRPVALGMARARTLRGETYSVAALIGDGALTGGLAYEGLNDAGASGEPMVVILIPASSTSSWPRI